MPKKKGKKKTKSESSTPRSSTPPVEDETRLLVRRGASGSSGQRTQPPDTNRGATSSRDASEYRLLPEVDTLSVPDEGAAAGGSKKSSKRSPILTSIRNTLRRMSLSPDAKCVCKDKKNHDPECSKSKELSAGDKCESPKGKSGKAKQISHLSRKDEASTRSSSSSNPSVGSSAEPLKILDENLLSVPAPESSAASPWRGALRKFKAEFTVFKRRANRSNSGSSYEDNNSSPKLKSPRRGQTKSGTSSSGSSSKSKGSGVSSGPSSKSSSTSDKISETPTKKKLSKGKQKSPYRGGADYNPREGTSRGGADYDPREGTSRGGADYDPREGTSRGGADYDPREGTSRGGADYDPREGTSRGGADYDPREGTSRGRISRRSFFIWISELFKVYIAQNRKKLVTVKEGTPIIEPMDEDLFPRCRSKSINKYTYRFRYQPRYRSPKRPILKSINIKLGSIKWPWFDKLRAKVTKSHRAEAGGRQNPGNARKDPLRLPDNQPDRDERQLISRAQADGPTQTLRRHESLSPSPSRKCQCNDKYLHKMGCSLFRRMRERRRKRGCRQDVSPTHSYEDS